jgi:hypothetical protein
MENMMAVSLKTFDKPIVFAIAVTFVVLGMMAVMSWAFNAWGWTGPLGLTKGGVVQ